jgi:hypothetical protein
MTPRISLKKALTGYRNYLKELRKPEMECGKSCFENNLRRRTVTQRFRNKFIEKNYKRLELTKMSIWPSRPGTRKPLKIS